MTQATILVADQEADHLLQLERIFQAAGYIPIGAKSSKEALETISRFNPDVCFLNPELPNLDAFSLQARIAERRAMPPIVLMLAMKTNSQTRQRYLSQFGASGVVNVPFSSNDVILAVENLIGKRHQPLIQDKTFSGTGDTFEDAPLASAFSTGEFAGDDSDSFNTLSDLLNEVSGHSKDLQDLSDRFKKPTKPLGESLKFQADPEIGLTPSQSQSTSTVRVSSEEVQREMARMREKMAEKPPRKHRPKLEKTLDPVLDKPRTRFTHGGATSEKDSAMGALTSSDIFGALIQDIESGEVDSKTPESKAEPAITSPSPPVPDMAFTPPGRQKLEPKKPLGPFATQPIPLEEAFEGAPESKEDPVLVPQDQQPQSGNQYQLLEKIASGGMAEVWKSKLIGEKGFEKIVAIKKILPHLGDNDEFITMFIDEAKVAANLTHPNIAQIYELGKMGDSFFIAMEHVGGYNLRQILNFCKGMNITIAPEVVVFIGMKLCNALNYAHLKKGYDNQPLNIVHRDVSPQNVLISHDGEIKLVDFGIAKASNKASQTIAGSLKGKLLYMSPEQADGKPTDARSDTFSLASVLYEALTGEKLFGGDSELSVLKNVRQAKYRPPREVNPNIPQLLEDILVKTLSKSPDDRYESAKELEKAFKFYLKQEKLHLNESDIAEYLKWIVEKDVEKLRAYANQRHQANHSPKMSLPKPSKRNTKPAMPPARPTGQSGSKGKKALWIALALVTLVALIWLILSLFVLNSGQMVELQPQETQQEICWHPPNGPGTWLEYRCDLPKSGPVSDPMHLKFTGNGLGFQTKGLVATNRCVNIGFRLT